MLTHLSIRDFAIIESLSLDFHQGFHIVTGETGAGKSILIEAMSLALGSRADTTFVRTGAAKATVELTVEQDDPEIRELLVANGLEPASTLLITREIQSGGKSLCRINGVPVTVAFLSRLCSWIADIHGQYDHQSLLDPESHGGLVDRFAGEFAEAARRATAAAYHTYRGLRQQLTSLTDGLAARERQLDFCRFERNEIEAAAPTTGEDAAIEERIAVLKHSETIRTALEETYAALFDGPLPARDQLGRSMQALERIAPYSASLAALSSALTDSYYQLEELQADIRKERDAAAFSPQELDRLMERLDLLDKLKRKYGGSLESVLAYRDKLSEELSLLEDKDQHIAVLTEETARAKTALKENCDQLSGLRREAALRLEAAIRNELKELNFKDSHLVIAFQECPPDFETICTENGTDRIEFLLVTNLGESPKPLAKIASGGEISRIMLAFKAVLGGYDRIPTLIFDEIDSGISGGTASVVGQKLKRIADSHQVICITHLPQIAALSDHHYRIEKAAVGGRVTTHVQPLAPGEKVQEIARLLGGMEVTEAALRNAEDLIRQATG